MNDTISTPETDCTFAALDLGSNSFHLIIARSDGGTLQIIDRHKEMVRLGEGLTADKTLLPEVADRALACLERIGQRLRAIHATNVRAVGTNTLRQLDPHSDFIERAQQALGHPIEVIAGREEARLIYLGVAHSLAIGDEKRLVVDIGGGSTELIIGEGFSPLLRESLYMGCVNMSQRFFANDKITAKAMAQAEITAAMEMRPVRELFRQSGWQTATGSSGTIKAIASVLNAEGWSDDGITNDGLAELRTALIDCGRISALSFKGLSERRRPVFVGGVAVLSAVFQNLDIEHLRVSDQALREGLLYEMIGRDQHEDVCQRTVSTFCRRFDVDLDHAAQVQHTALQFFEQLRAIWSLDHLSESKLLGWAAQLHEIGLAVAHTQYQKHGAYLICNADLPGFTRTEQEVLAALVLGQRRKFPLTTFAALPSSVRENTPKLCIILRLAKLLHRGRTALTTLPTINVCDNQLTLTFPDEWLQQHPLTRLELEQEAEQLAVAGWNLNFC